MSFKLLIKSSKLAYPVPCGIEESPLIQTQQVGFPENKIRFF